MADLIYINMANRLCNSIRESKTEKRRFGNEDFLPVSIPALQGSFDPEGTRWDIERGELKARESQIYSLYKKEQLRQLLLMHMLAVKEVNLTKCRKKIASLLKENTGILEMQGFQVNELLKIPEIQHILNDIE